MEQHMNENTKPAHEESGSGEPTCEHGVPPDGHCAVCPGGDNSAFPLALIYGPDAASCNPMFGYPVPAGVTAGGAAREGTEDWTPDVAETRQLFDNWIADWSRSMNLDALRQLMLVKKGVNALHEASLAALPDEERARDGDTEPAGFICDGYAISPTQRGGILVERGETGALCIYGTEVEARAVLAKMNGVSLVPVSVTHRAARLSGEDTP